MKTHQVIHRVALVALAVVAAGSVHGSLRNPTGNPVAGILQPIFALALWAFLLWKVATRPRQWGMGMGIFLLLMVAFQTHLFRLAVANPTLALPLPSWTYFLVFDELPIFIAGVSCILLRFRYPLPASDTVPRS